MLFLRKVFARLSDPIFYAKRWRQVLRPLRLGNGNAVRAFKLEDLPRSPKAVLVIAHPDDELFASGLLCELAARKGKTTVICLTRGEGGISGPWKREELGEARENEMRKSCKHLGVTNIRFLGHVDPYTETERVYAPRVSVATLAEQLQEHLLEIKPDIVITHGSNGEYWHPAHLMLNQALNRVSPKLGKMLLATFNAWQPEHPLPQFLNMDDPANLTVDASKHHSARLSALLCHESQLEWFQSFTRCTPEDFIDQSSREGYFVRYFSLKMVVLFFMENCAELSLCTRVFC